MKYKLKLDKLKLGKLKLNNLLNKKGQSHSKDFSFCAHFSKKNAYLQIDLMVSVLIFFFIVFLVFNFFDIFNDNSDNSLIVQNLASDSRDLCFLLTSSSGLPLNWEDDISSLEFIGLKKVDFNEIDSSKLSRFNSSNYLFILDNLNLSGYFKVDIVGLNSSVSYLSLGNSGGEDSYFSKSSCYSIYNNELVQVIVEVWR